MPIRSPSRTPWSRGGPSADLAGFRRLFHAACRPALVAACLAAAPVAFAAAGSFPYPDRVRYDGQCFTIDGKDVFIFSGSFHYFRCPKALWADRFRRIKAAGCNAVETYVPWNWSERAEPSGLDDFSHVDLSDFRAWLRMAHDQFGLYTIIRPGPYICAEWDGGGFPRWLLTKRPAGRRPWLRSDDPVYLDWCRHWMRAVCPVIAPEQVTRRRPGTGGVILVQIENEYDLYQPIPAAERVPALKALYEAAVAGGIDVPIFTCWTRQCRDSADPELAKVFDAINSYPRFKIEETAQHLAALEAAQPDAPEMISELQGGWFGRVGGLLSQDQPGLTAAQLTADTLLAIQNGATALNYYMIFGGTNFGRWGGRDITTSYDYDAPIRENGGVGDKYLALEAIGRMLQRHGAELARSYAISCEAQTGSADVTIAARATHAGVRYVFLRNRSLDQWRRGTAAVWLEHLGEIGIDYNLPPFGSRVLRFRQDQQGAAEGEWMPRPVDRPKRPAPGRIPAAVHPDWAETRADPGWRPAGADASAIRHEPSGRMGIEFPGEGRPVRLGPAALLPELGVDDPRPVEYEGEATLSAVQAGGGVGVLRFARYRNDPLVAEVNGRLYPADHAGEMRVAGLRPGRNRIRVLYVQRGEQNFGPGIEDEAGLRSASLTVLPSGAAIPIEPWRVVPASGGEAAGWPGLGPGALAEWTRVRLDASEEVPAQGALRPFSDEGNAPPTLLRWYRVPFALPKQQADAWVPWGVRIDAAGDGDLWVNGHSLGRIWEEGPQREYYLPECWLKFGGAPNVLTLSLAPTSGRAALRAVEIAPYAAQAEDRSR